MYLYQRYIYIYICIHIYIYNIFPLDSAGMDRAVAGKSLKTCPAVLPGWNGHVRAKLHLWVVRGATLDHGQFINVIKTTPNHPTG